MLKNIIKKALGEIMEEDKKEQNAKLALLNDHSPYNDQNRYIIERIDKIEHKIAAIQAHLKIQILPVYKKFEVQEWPKNTNPGGTMTAGTGVVGNTASIGDRAY